MLFTDLISEVRLGKRITRTGWDDKRHYIVLRDYILQLHKAGEDESDTHPWIISEEDLVAEDWEVINDSKS